MRKPLTSLIVGLALVGATLPAAAQDDPCQPQEAAVEAATAAAAPLDEAFSQTLGQFAALGGPVAAEAPELAAAQGDLLGQLAKMQQSALLQASGQDQGSSDADAASASALLDADLAQLQAGVVAPDGAPRPNVTMAANLAQQAKDQQQAVAAANAALGQAAQALAACAEAAAGG